MSARTIIPDLNVMNVHRTHLVFQTASHAIVPSKVLIPLLAIQLQDNALARVHILGDNVWHVLKELQELTVMNVHLVIMASHTAFLAWAVPQMGHYRTYAIP